MSLSASLPVARRYRLRPDLDFPWPGAVVPADVLAIARSAARILAEARAVAEGIVEEAHARAEAVVVDAVTRAQAEVWREAGAALDALQRRRQAHERDAETLLARLGQACLERLRIDLGAPWPSVSSARLLIEEWGRWRSAGRAQLRVNPGDLDELSRAFAHCAEVEIVPAADLAPGDCTLSCGAGELRASFEGGLHALRQALAAAGREFDIDIQSVNLEDRHGD